jgi:hypothetical protein
MAARVTSAAISTDPTAGAPPRSWLRPAELHSSNASQEVIYGQEMDHFKLRADHDERAFDSYAMVDWSSNSRPKRGSNSIWIASGTWSGHAFSEDEAINCPTRTEAMRELRQKLDRWAGKRVLVGFDFAFGYPAGFASALGLPISNGAWRAIHSHFAAHVTDCPKNMHNRDLFATECNRKVGGPGPFWGCTKSVVTTELKQSRVFDFPYHGLQELRATDIEARNKGAIALSVWKLNCGVSVGGQTILGIKYLHELAEDVGAHIWPFEGWGVPKKPAIWLAEIFPSLVPYAGSDSAECRDRMQVRNCVRWAAERDCDGSLKGDFDRPALDPATLAQVENEEGWILWGCERSAKSKVRERLSDGLAESSRPF